MPSARWACSSCGRANAASAEKCVNCGAPCPILQESSAWTCPACSLSNIASICSGCQYRKPLPKDGVPQIFEGMRIVFTGIIPRSIPHSSEWREWQTAEQRGAQPLDALCESMTHLIYKEGYERSEKVKRALRMKGQNVKVLISDWFYQSINLGHALEEEPYDLRGPQRALRAAKVQNEAGDIAVNFQDQIINIGKTKPKGKESAKLVTKVLTGKGEFTWLNQEEQERTTLFTDRLSAVFSVRVPPENRKLAETHGARVCAAVSDDATHLIVADEDDEKDEGKKKRRMEQEAEMIERARLMGLHVVSVEWLQNCVQAHEVLPAAGPYKRPR